MWKMENGDIPHFAVTIECNSRSQAHRGLLQRNEECPHFLAPGLSHASDPAFFFLRGSDNAKVFVGQCLVQRRIVRAKRAPGSPTCRTSCPGCLVVGVACPRCPPALWRKKYLLVRRSPLLSPTVGEGVDRIGARVYPWRCQNCADKKVAQR